MICTAQSAEEAWLIYRVKLDPSSSVCVCDCMHGCDWACVYIYTVCICVCVWAVAESRYEVLAMPLTEIQCCVRAEDFPRRPLARCTWGRIKGCILHIFYTHVCAIRWAVLDVCSIVYKKPILYFLCVFLYLQIYLCRRRLTIFYSRKWIKSGLQWNSINQFLT